MKGLVDEFGHAIVQLIVQLIVRSKRDGSATEIPAWVDTAFNGELVIPQTMIDAIGLQQSGGIRARLADGKDVILEAYSCEIDWFGRQRLVEVVANEGELPLLGVGLLLGHRLTVDYTDLTLSIE